jgi:hypothetical protein
LTSIVKYFFSILNIVVLVKQINPCFIFGHFNAFWTNIGLLFKKIQQTWIFKKKLRDLNYVKT